MDWLNLFFIVALIYFFSSLQKRKKQRGQAPEERQDPQAPPETSETKPAAPAETHGSYSYDYERFRRKLRRAWKLPEAETGEEADAEDHVEEETCREERPVRTSPAPAPVPEPSAPMTAEEAERLRRWQDYARRQEAPAPAAATAIGSAEPADREPRSLPHRWTERDAEQWMIYDAVFGEPRSRRRWRPLNGERGR